MRSDAPTQDHKLWVQQQDDVRDCISKQRGGLRRNILGNAITLYRVIKYLGCAELQHLF
jgi:hypothetical protein